MPFPGSDGPGSDGLCSDGLCSDVGFPGAPARLTHGAFWGPCAACLQSES